MEDNKYADLDDEVTDKKLRQVWNDLTLGLHLLLGDLGAKERPLVCSGLRFRELRKQSRFIARCLRGRSRFRRGSSPSYPGGRP